MAGIHPDVVSSEPGIQQLLGVGIMKYPRTSLFDGVRSASQHLRLELMGSESEELAGHGRWRYKLNFYISDLKLNILKFKWCLYLKVHGSSNVSNCRTFLKNFPFIFYGVDLTQYFKNFKVYEYLVQAGMLWSIHTVIRWILLYHKQCRGGHGCIISWTLTNMLQPSPYLSNQTLFIKRFCCGFQNNWIVCCNANKPLLVKVCVAKRLSEADYNLFHVEFVRNSSSWLRDQRQHRWSVRLDFDRASLCGLTAFQQEKTQKVPMSCVSALVLQFR